MENWMSLRAYARHRGDRLSAVQKAIATGRVNASAVRRDERGRLVAIDQVAADRQWAANTDPVAALKNGKMPAARIAGTAPDKETPPRENGGGSVGGSAPAVQGSAAAAHESAGSRAVVVPGKTGEPRSERAAAGADVRTDAAGNLFAAPGGELPPGGEVVGDFDGAAGDPAEPAAAVKDGDDPHGYFAARASREKFGAKRAELDYFERLGVLVSRDAVRAEQFEILREIRDNLLLVPARVSQRFASETDPMRIEQLLLEQLRAVLAELSQRFGADAVAAAAVVAAVAAAEPVAAQQ